MAEAAMNITDIELVRLLKASYIDREQVKEIQILIPEMTGEERQQLLALIDQSHGEAEKAESAYQERLRDINAQYDIELNSLLKESTERALKEFEEVEKKEAAEELKEVEGEMATMSSNTHSTKPAEGSEQVEEANPVQPTRNRHVIAKLIVIFLFFLIILAIAIYSNLNT